MKKIIITSLFILLVLSSGIIQAKTYCFVFEDEYKCIYVADGKSQNKVKNGAGGGGRGNSSHEVNWMQSYLKTNPNAIQNKDDILKQIKKISKDSDFRTFKTSQ